MFSRFGVDMSKQSRFYNDGTERKLQAIEKYLQRYLLVFKNQPNRKTIYVDAFAGTGELPLARKPQSELFTDQLDADTIISGSALRALSLQQKFSSYIFIDERAAKIEELKRRLAENGHSSQDIRYIKGNANVELAKLCPELSLQNVRAVVFLDPYGNQVGWDLLQKLAATKNVDLWYLFPAFLGVYRQFGNKSAKMTPEQENSISFVLGPNNWRDAFIEREQGIDLFGPPEVAQKIADVEDITRHMIKSMKNIYKGGVNDSWLPLGRDGAHWYSLIFAMANPSPPAVRLGHELAKHIMTHT